MLAASVPDIVEKFQDSYFRCARFLTLRTSAPSVPSCCSAGGGASSSPCRPKKLTSVCVAFLFDFYDVVDPLDADDGFFHGYQPGSGKLGYFPRQRRAIDAKVIGQLGMIEDQVERRLSGLRMAAQ